MHFQLIEDAGYQFRKLWTVRIMLLGVLLNSLAGCMFLFQDWIAPLTYLIINVGLNIAAIIARMCYQSKAHRDAGPTEIDTFF